MATIENITLPNQTTDYSSGPIDVHAYKELAIDSTVTALSTTYGVRLQVSRIGSDGNLYTLSSTDFQQPGATSINIGAGMSIPNCFGDAIQLDMTVFTGDSISLTLSILGK